jgi:Domain of unknown function (DUF4158)
MVQAVYDSEDSIDAWTLTPEDHVRIADKSRANRLAFAVLLLFFRANGRFPDVAEIHPSFVVLVAQQLGIDTGPIADQAWQLIWEHVNPYGRFELNMETRLDLSPNGPR